MVNDRESITATILRLEATRQSLMELLAKENASEKAKQKTQEALAKVDAELARLADESNLT
jgi:hypothetical protein